MTDMHARVRKSIDSELLTGCSIWPALLKLYEDDREAFYMLAVSGYQQDPQIERLGLLARRIRNAIRMSYSFSLPSSGDAQIVTVTDSIPFDADLFPRVKQFLLEIDGKGVSGKKGKDYEGRVISKAEVQFKLGDYMKDEQ
jgi:hypothetical protein